MLSIRKVAIFGGTGKTGQCAVDAALTAGIAVTVLVRDPSRVSSDVTGRVAVVQGDVLDEIAVEQAVHGQDAVVVVLGTRNDLSPTTMMSEGLKNILSAMDKYGIKQVSACMSAFLFYEPDRVPPRYIDVNADHQRMLDILNSRDDLDWVAVLPPHITEGPGYGNYTVLHGKNPGRTIAKQDLGHFLVHSLENPEHYKQTCGICDLTA